MIAVRIQEEVLDYLKRLAPQPRHALRLAIKNLAREKGDILPRIRFCEVQLSPSRRDFSK